MDGRSGCGAAGRRLDGLTLRTLEWRVRGLAVREVHSSFFNDANRFPKGTVAFDHGLIMRDIAHEWHKADDLYTLDEVSA